MRTIKRLIRFNMVLLMMIPTSSRTSSIVLPEGRSILGSVNESAISIKDAKFEGEKRTGL